MNPTFFDLPVQEQTRSLTQFAVQILQKYGIEKAHVACINFEFNATFSVHTETGQKFALRLNINSTRVQENIQAEVEWVRFLGNIKAINVPSPIATISDEFIVSGFHQDSGRLIYGVMYSWLEGAEIGDEPTLQQLKVIGRSMALIHHHSSDFVPQSPAKLPTYSDFLWGTQDFLFTESSGLDSGQRAKLEEARDVIIEEVDKLYKTSKIHIIHADFHGWNLMWNKDQLYIFDFDDCGFGVEQQDIAVALYYLDTPEQEAALLEGYKSVRELAHYSNKAMKSLLLQRRLLLLNYLFETKNPDHKQMLPAYLEKSLERVSTFLTDVRQ